MIKRPATVARITTPIKLLAQRFAYAVLLVTAAAIMIVGKADPTMFERTRSVVTDTVAPILNVVSRPVASAKNAVDEVRHLINLRGENAMLRTENAKLRQWRDAAQMLEADNKKLRALLHFPKDQNVPFISARVIADTGGAFVRSVIVNAGIKDGVGKGMPVVIGNGLIGRVAEVGHHASRVLLISDLNSRIPVVVGPDQERAMLVGDNTTVPKLIYLAANAQVPIGAHVMTSGHGGAFPAGLPVGSVGAINEGGIQVQGFANADSLEFVSIMDYGLKNVLNQELNHKRPVPAASK